MTNPSVKSAAQPLSTKRRDSKGYPKRVKRMIGILSGAQPLSRAERATQAHFWLDASFEEGNRRMRSPAERLADQAKDLPPKTSVAY